METKEILRPIKSAIKGNFWLEGKFGIEKENIRVDDKGNLSLKPHPKVFGNKLKHPYITTDFSESQVEMVTPPLPSIGQAVKFLDTIQSIVINELDGEFLWPQSTPPILPDEQLIPIAEYGEDGKNARDYREFLAKKYGKKNQLFSGIHFNISFDENLLEMLYRSQKPNVSYMDFKNHAYMKTTRQLLRNRWLYILLYGNSPVVEDSFQLKCKQPPYMIDKNVIALSIRNSCYGYRNIGDLYPDYSSLKSYLESIEEFVTSGKIASQKELYTAVRPKFLNGKDEISYLETRFIDIDPTNKTGVSEESLQFIHLMALYGLLTNEPDNFNEEYQALATKNHGYIAHYGLQYELQIYQPNNQRTDAWAAARKLIENIYELLEILDIKEAGYNRTLRNALELTNQHRERKVFEVFKGVMQKGYVSYHIENAKIYAEQSRLKNYIFEGFNDLELSTQLLLREAVRRGVAFEILDRNENFIRLSRNGNTQYVKQATKTSLDNYASVLAMENKLVTKKILDEHGINTPRGFNYSKMDLAKSKFEYFRGKAIVIKPNQTNYGLGITIIKDNNDKQLFDRAIAIAFEYDSTILIEDFIEGKEFRVFVINNEVVGILHRVPANVTGNGKDSIRELVRIKNLDPIRGEGYRTPLEKIMLGEAEAIFLKAQDRDFDTVPAKNEMVFLRENSNISTGGDSIDYTEEIPESYKAVAVEAAKALNANITGLDMIIKDYTKEANDENYSIIEMNFNPAIHIHCFPYKGKQRKLNEKLMDALGYNVPVNM